MSSFKKEVKAIIEGHDVRDPRGALLAIERLLDAKITGQKKPKRLLRIDILKGPLPGTYESVILYDKGDMLTAAKAMFIVKSAIAQFAEEHLTEQANTTQSKENTDV